MIDESPGKSSRLPAVDGETDGPGQETQQPLGSTRAVRRSIRVEIHRGLVKKFQHAAIDQDRTFRDLVEEAMQDFVALKLNRAEGTHS